MSVGWGCQKPESARASTLVFFGLYSRDHSSNDNGTTFNATGPSTSKNLNNIDSVSDLIAFAAADGGSVFKTIDAGAHWEELAVASAGTTFKGIDFVDNQTGWVVGSQGAIFKTDDGGTTWNAQTSGTAVALNDIDASQTGEAWIAGDGGVLLHTGNGGTAWEAKNSGTTANLRAVGMASLFDRGFFDTGYLAGEGFLAETTDAGASWNNITPSGTLSGNFNAFMTFGSSLNNLILVGDDDLILKGDTTIGLDKISVGP